MKRTLHAAITTMALCFSATFQTHAQQPSAIQPAGPFTNNGFFEKIYDRKGNTYKLSDLVIRQSNALPGRTSGAIVQCSSAGYFNLFFEPGCGMDSTTTQTMARRNVICQVFTDLSAFITPANPNVKVNIWIRNLANVPGIGNACVGGSLAVGSAFYVIPASTPKPGIVDGEVWRTINSGRDSYTGVTSPLTTVGGQTAASSGGFFHGFIAFNFCDSNNVKWHTDLSQVTAAGTYDMYTIALHEITHALGFSSLIDSAGVSGFKPGFYYSRYDLKLKAANGQSLITNSGSCNLYNFAYTASTRAVEPNPFHCVPGTTTCSTAVTYNSAVIGALAQPVYTPNCFENGSSLSHFEDICHNPTAFADNQYYLMSDAQGKGPAYMKRFWKPEERNVLCDLGYQTLSTFGSAANHNFENYLTGCGGPPVAGTNDGIDSTNGTFKYVVTLGDTISVSDILKNDANAVRFECLEDIYGNGTIISTTATTFLYKGTAAGEALLRYVPVGSTGKRGNITYVLLYVKNNNCTPTACSMLNNGGFENGTVCGIITPGSPGQVACWEPYSSTPDLYLRGCTTDNTFDIPTISDTWDMNTSNTAFIGLYADPNLPSLLGGPMQEAIQTTLNTPLTHNTQYTVTFLAKVRTNGGDSYSTPPAHIDIAALPGMIATLNNYDHKTVTILDSTTVIPNDGEWYPVSKTFTYSGAAPLSDLIIAHAAYHNIDPNTSMKPRYIFIDDVTLTPTAQVVRFTPPSQVCTGQTINNLLRFVSPPVPGGIFTGPGVSQSGGVYNFDATAAGVGNHIIAYTFTNVNGCKTTLPALITVNVDISAMANSPVTCKGDSNTLYVNSSVPCTYVWSPAAGLSSTTGAVVKAAPSVTTTYTVTALCPGACGTFTPTAQVRAFVHVPFAIVTPSVQTICPGNSANLGAIAVSNVYQWQVNGKLVFSQNITVSPTVTTTYTVTIQDDFFCHATQSGVVIVSSTPAPTATITPTYAPICPGQTVTLNAKGGVSYVWSGGTTTSTDSVITVSPTVTTTYKVIVSNSIGCTGTALEVITVNTPPTITATATYPNICAGATATLTGGGGLHYVWSDGTTNTAPTGNTLVVSPTVMSIYTVTGTDAKGCTGTATVTVNVSNNCCSSCANPIGQSGFITSSPPAGGVYCINNDVTIRPAAGKTITFFNSEFKIASGVTITVPAGITLNVNGSHLYCCATTNMWQGIMVLDSGNAIVTTNQTFTIGQLVPTTHYSLIEDAKVAITMNGDSASIGTLSVNGATFNRNYVGIEILNYLPQTNTFLYPFAIQNSLFTSRQIPFTPGALNWNTTPQVTATATTTSSLQSPYINGATYPSIAVKQPGLGYPQAGVAIINSGLTTISSTFNFYEIQVGRTGSAINGPNFNLFDNQGYGVFALASNVTCVNNIFQYSQNVPNPASGIPGPGAGIQASVGTIALLSDFHRLRVIPGNTNNNSYFNRFYNCYTAVSATNYYDQTITWCDIRGTLQRNFNNTFFHFCQTGIAVTTSIFGNVRAENNSIYDIETGIAYTGNLFGNQASSINPFVNINMNTIQPVPNGLFGVMPNPGNNFVASAIIAKNASTSNPPKLILRVDSNILNTVYRGIDCESWRNSVTLANHNNITLVNDAATTNVKPQWGIKFANNLGRPSNINQVENNTITGPGVADTTIKAIYSGLSLNQVLTCNTVSNTGIGFDFVGGCLNTAFTNNTMSQHKFGMQLDFVGVIGPQGSNGNPIDDHWNGNWSGQTNTPNPNNNFKTTTLNGSSSQQSPIWVRSNTALSTGNDPSGSAFTDNRITPTFVRYTSANGSVHTTVGSIPTGCGGSGGVTAGGVHFATSANIHLMEQITLDQVPFTVNTAQTQFIDKHLIFDLIMADTSLMDSSAVLRQFVSKCQSHCIGQLYNIDAALNAGNLAQAHSLANSLDMLHPTEVSYQTYYNILIKLHTDTMPLNPGDSSALITLAQGCPFTDGAVVYNARALYNATYHVNGVFNDNCIATIDNLRKGVANNPGSGLPVTKNTAANGFDAMVFPNPTTGQVFITPYVLTEGTLQVEVRDITGKLVYNDKLQINGGMTNFTLSNDVNSGVYFIRITNTATNESTLKKLVIQK